MLSFNTLLTPVSTVAKIAGVCLLLLLARGVFWLFNMMFILPLLDPMRKLPGPTGSLMQNHFREVTDPKYSPDVHEEWRERFGKTFRFHGFGKHDFRLMTFDFRVLTHVLNSPTYEKPWQTRALLARLIGRGIFSIEGSEHKTQRRLIGPAFTSTSVKTMVPIFLQKARQMCERWDSLISEPFLDVETPMDPPPAYAAVATASEKFRGRTIDVAHWTSRASFDVIGLAGFDYRFNSLDDESEAVYSAYRRMFNVADKGPRMRGVLELYFPIIRTLWPDNGTKVTNESLGIIDKAGRKLVAAKKAAVLAEAPDVQDNQQKDILSLLIKANLSTDSSKRLSDVELLDQCSTFLLAGSDSVSLAISWCLHYLSQNSKIQSRLRDELLSISPSLSPSYPAVDYITISTEEKYPLRATPPPTYCSTDYSVEEHWDEIEASPYLDAVVRETLRICPPVHGTIRVATADDKIPVSHPVVLQDGTVVEEGGHISIRKGSYIHIPIEGLNLSTEIWGSDAQVFNPDRWSCLPPSACSPAHPGLGNMMTFGFGPHSCLGYKFCISEMKAFLATMLPQFVFTPAEGVEISKFNAILTRPYISGKWDKGTQLPIVVGRYTT